jgi:ribosome-associated protein
LLRINETLAVPENEIEIRGIRAQGPGGQHVNKVSSAVHLRFDIPGSSLPQHLKDRLLALADSRVTKQGVVNLKVGHFRSRERNREMARQRLRDLISRAGLKRKKRKQTKPGPAARRRRLETKARRGRMKALRGKVLERE